jgi:hypothetical protein
MSGNKTVESDASVMQFLNSLTDERQRADSHSVLKMMKAATGLSPKMWGTAIVGFGSVHYTYESGREGDICLMGFSPRKSNIVLYLPGGHAAYADELSSLGTYKTGKGCLYIAKLANVDLTVLKKIIGKAAKRGKST